MGAWRFSEPLGTGIQATVSLFRHSLHRHSGEPPFLPVFSRGIALARTRVEMRIAVSAAGAVISADAGPARVSEIALTDHTRHSLSPSVQQMLREIEQRYFEPLTLDVLAARLTKDPRHLGRRFRLELGVSVHDYLVQVRLDHAAMAIRRGVKIEAVSLLVGYRSKKNFFAAFKRRFGMTPGVYASPDANGSQRIRSAGG
jgi:transcriptional regulator GlxA family with amidase domain